MRNRFRIAVEVLMSLHNGSEPKTRFGMPGSGNPRCNVRSDGIMAIGAVRLSANKELGESFVQHLTSDDGKESFTLLNSQVPANEHFHGFLFTRRPNRAMNELPVIVDEEAQSNSSKPLRCAHLFPRPLAIRPTLAINRESSIVAPPPLRNARCAQLAWTVSPKKCPAALPRRRAICKL